MTYDILEELYTTQKRIHELSDELESLRVTETELIAEIVERKIEQTDSYVLKTYVKQPNRSVCCNKLRELHPSVYTKVTDNIRKVLKDKFEQSMMRAGEKITIADVRKYLGEEELDEVLERAGDPKITYSVGRL